MINDEYAKFIKSSKKHTRECRKNDLRICRNLRHLSTIISHTNEEDKEEMEYLVKLSQIYSAQMESCECGSKNEDNLNG
jgi:N-glycosylase/DNA lyase